MILELLETNPRERIEYEVLINCHHIPGKVETTFIRIGLLEAANEVC